MNYLAIDYGTKNIGLAYTVNNIIFTLPPLVNDDQFIHNIQGIISQYSIEKIYIGLSYGRIAKLTKKFISSLSAVIKLPIETVDEAASTIEASEIYKRNHHDLVDSVAAAVILRRVIN
jgi:RNase H-fold protein (predicted Holliday junction resolvase)